MRVIGGSLGGRRLEAPKGDLTRPTSDRVREAVFNILGPPPLGAQVLDLYAGSGAMGIEALSRGASFAVFVDHAAPALAVLRKNLTTLALGDRTEVIRLAAAKALDRLEQAPRPFHWVFVDPPYAGDEAVTSLGRLDRATRLLGLDAVIVVEHDRRRPPPERLVALSCDDRRRYGDTEVSFYRMEPR